MILPVCLSCLVTYGIWGVGSNLGKPARPLRNSQVFGRLSSRDDGDGLAKSTFFPGNSQRIMVDAVFSVSVLSLVSAEHGGTGQTHRDEPPFRMGIQKGAEVLHSHETMERLGILATDFLGIRTSTLRSYSTSSHHFEYITKLRYPFSKRDSHII